MLVVTYSEARRTFASVLDRAQEDGAVIIRRADGSQFRVVPEEVHESPFDGITTNIRVAPGESLRALAEARGAESERFDR